MALVDYSDSEDSSDETPQRPHSKSVPKAPTGPSTSNFAVDKSNPRKIRVNLQETVPPPSTHNGTDIEPAAKRARTVGAFGAFNALLPAPKKSAENTKPLAIGAKTRKLFSLKTGAEPGFSRESDAELRELFTEESNSRKEGLDELGNNAPRSMDEVPSSPPKIGNAMMFKPLSVARNPQKRRKTTMTTPNPPNPGAAGTPERLHPTPPVSLPPKKMSLFSAGDISESSKLVLPERAEEDDEEKIAVDSSESDERAMNPSSSHDLSQSTHTQPQSLEAIASDLNLSASDRRQLLGRHGNSASTAINIVNFNTDAEYAANEELRASGEQVQHNPVRAIASGKHSLKQLVSAATGQKEALEESFATGRRNKKEAGNKYGW